MGNRGLKASNRRPFTEPFRTAQKRKASPSHQVRIWARHTFTGEFDKRAVYPFLAMFLVILAGSSVVLSAGPLFHSYILGAPSHCTDYSAHEGLIRTGRFNQCLGDPSTYLWHTDGVALGSSLTEWNTNGGNLVAGLAGCTPFCGMAEAGNSTNSAIALSKNPIDFSVLSAKQLWTLLTWSITNIISCCGNNIPWGMYLTTNSTVPNGKGPYNPESDSAVALVLRFSSTGGGAAGTFNMELFIQKNTQTTILSQDDGTCHASGSCYLFQTYTFNPIAPAKVEPEFFLNFTGATNGGVCANAQGSGCSSIEEASSTTFISAQTLPWLAFAGVKYYVGFWTQSSNYQVNWAFDQSTVPSACTLCMESILYVPTPTAIQTPPNIDTGGFFGPLINALIQLGVFIASNIINFLNYLYNLVAPLLAGAATVIGNVMIAVMNALGTVFGDSTLGTQISTAFTNIVNYLTNIFTSAVGIWTNILTGLLNILNFVTKFLSITVSGGATLFAFIEGFFSTMVNFWTVFVGVWNQFMKFYIAGTFTIQYILVGWWIWGMYENFSLGVKDGLMDAWLQPSQTFLLAFFKAGYWLLDEAYKFVVQLKQLIFGNRISPGTIAGNG